MLLFIDKKFIFVFEYELDKLLLVGSQEVLQVPNCALLRLNLPPQQLNLLLVVLNCVPKLKCIVSTRCQKFAHKKSR